MKNCSHCGGNLLRHGVTHYTTDPSIVGVRYRCIECNKTFTQRMSEDENKGSVFFNATGRPYRKDWRMAA